MDMLPSRKTEARKLAALFAAVVVVVAGSSITSAGDPKAPAGPGSGSSSVSIGIPTQAIRTGYPIALPAGVSGDASANATIQQVQAFDLTVSGVFTVADPAQFTADPKAEGMGADPANWKPVGVFAVVKYRTTASSVEFKLYEIAKGSTPTLEKTYPRGKDANDIRAITHKWCNELHKQIVKEPGFFGSKIAFAVKSGKSAAIMAMDFDGANAYAVSNNSSINLFPAWSPNGGQIAYTSFMRDNPDLYVGPAGGGRPKKISAQRGMNTGAAWSPNGSEIAVTLSKDGNAEIYVIKASDGSIVRRLTNNKAIDTSPAWSPDGSLIAFVSDRNGGPQIFTVPAGGGGATLVSTIGSYNSTPAWSPKAGKHVLAYTTNAGGAMDIVTLDLDTKEMKRITQGAGNNEEPSFSPNGRAIAFARIGDGVYITAADGSTKATKVWSGSATGIDWGPLPPP